MTKRWSSSRSSDGVGIVLLLLVAMQFLDGALNRKPLAMRESVGDGGWAVVVLPQLDST